jgi:hypothetical protein
MNKPILALSAFVIVAALSLGICSSIIINDHVQKAMQTPIQMPVDVSIENETDHCLNLNYSFHLLVEHYRNGVLLSSTYHPLTIVDQGLTQLKLLAAQQNSSGLIYFSLSNDSSAVSTAWTILPNEITTDGLERANATYVNGATLGTWNMTHTFTVTGLNATKLYGVNYNSGTSLSLCAAEQQGISNQKNLGATDTLALTMMGTVAQG